MQKIKRVKLPRRKGVTITPDHTTKPMRLCWRAHSGGEWFKSEYVKMTEAHAERLVAYYNRAEPDCEHWTEIKE